MSEQTQEIDVRDLSTSEVVERLKAIDGVRWNRRRNAWQHPCGVFRPRANHEPRSYYGMQRIVEEEEKA